MNTALEGSSPDRTSSHIADLLLPISLVLWEIGVSRTNTTRLGPYGLPAVLPITFYAGVAVLVVSAAFELARARPSSWRMSLHAGGLVVMLYGTAPLVYAEGRYSWLYKTVGVVQYINAHGQLNHNIDIYQNWSGFFALAAWFGKVAGVATPLAYAKWAQLVFELAALPLLYLAYDALSLSVRQRWLALMLYSGSNWIGQDYFSPQGLGTLLSLGIMAIALRWLYVGNRSRSRRSAAPRRVSPRAPSPQPKHDDSGPAAITRAEVLEAYHAVRSQPAPPGIDGVSINDFDRDLPGNLQKVWTGMTSGNYFPDPVRAVPVTRGGRVGTLRVLTVSDRVTQKVIARRLETQLRDIRNAQPGGAGRTSATLAPGNWTIQLDARAVYSRCRHDLLLKAVEASTDQTWITTYVRRCLKGAVQNPDRSLSPRRHGTAQGSPLSSVLADLFLYYTLDVWLETNFPDLAFERQLHTAVIHCTSEQQVASVRSAVMQRLEHVGLDLRPSRVQVVPQAKGLQPEGAADFSTGADRGTAGAGQEAVAQPQPSAQATQGQPSGQASAEPRRATAPAVRSLRFCALLMLIFFVLTFTHELSPYILIVEFAVLAACGLLRPRWLPFALAAIAIGYLLPRLSYVNSHYGLLSSIGNFFNNATPPSSSTSSTVAVSASQHLIERCEEVLSLCMWALAGVGAWMRRRSTRTVLALVFLAYSPILILAVQAYGNEGVLRVFLFSLPWTAALAASALAPLPTLVRTSKARSIWRLLGHPAIRDRLPAGALRAPLVLGAVLALFFPAFFGDDSFNYMSQTEVSLVTSLLQHAPVGPVYCGSLNAPVADTARYNLFPLPVIFGANGLTTRATPGIANLIARDSLSYTNNTEPAYVLITPSMINYSKAYGLVSPRDFAILLASLAHSPKWKLIASESGTVIYELPPSGG